MANRIGEKILGSFPHDDDTRKKANAKLDQNYRASEFYTQLTPLHRPNMSFDKDFKEKFPEAASIFESWKTTSCKEDFQLLEN